MPPLDVQQIVNSRHVKLHATIHSMLVTSCSTTYGTVHENQVFCWDKKRTTTFQKLKMFMFKTQSVPLHYYQTDLSAVIHIDVSKLGLGAYILQNGKPEALALKSLTDAYSQCANIKRELLAVVLCEHFHTCLHGCSFVVEMDQKPLEMIILKTQEFDWHTYDLQRMILHLQQFDVTIRYRPDSETPFPASLVSGREMKFSSYSALITLPSVTAG